MESMVNVDFQTIYGNKKIFVTGHTGFKGSWLITWLHSLGAKTRGYALAPEIKNSLYTEIGGDQLCDSVIANITDKENVRKQILSFEPDFIFHLAAQPLVKLSYEIPIETFNVNSQGTAHVLDALRFLEKPCVAVMVTTDKVYHNLEIDYAYSEDDKLGGFDPYSASKASAEIVIDSYRNSFFNPNNYDKHKKTISSARAGNVIGGGDWAKDRIIPDIIRALSANRDVEVRNPDSVRPWQHVLEPIYGYLLLGAKQQQEPSEFASAFNFGPLPEDVIKVEGLVQKSIECWGSGIYKKVVNLGQPHEAKLLQLDISKALLKLNWKPKMNANEAIKKTIDWYKGYILDKIDARTLTESQINEFITHINS